MAAEFFDNPAPDGKVRAAGDDGLPCWIDAPVASHESLVAQAQHQRSVLRARAESEITWRQGAVDEEIATAEEAAALSEWKKYRVMLMRVDTSVAPDIEWPEKPA
ncbi:tail fiber assembly protein [Citrobacter freundii]|nr:tail fiber assembly protein [Citrobacter freundii]